MSLPYDNYTYRSSSPATSNISYASTTPSRRARAHLMSPSADSTGAEYLGTVHSGTPGRTTTMYERPQFAPPCSAVPPSTSSVLSTAACSRRSSPDRSGAEGSNPGLASCEYLTALSQALYAVHRQSLDELTAILTTPSPSSTGGSGGSGPAAASTPNPKQRSAASSPSRSLHHHDGEERESPTKGRRGDSTSTGSSRSLPSPAAQPLLLLSNESERDLFIQDVEDRVFSHYLDYTMALHERLVQSEEANQSLRTAVKIREASNEALKARVGQLESLLFTATSPIPRSAKTTGTTPSNIQPSNVRTADEPASVANPSLATPQRGSSLSTTPTKATQKNATPAKTQPPTAPQHRKTVVSNLLASLGTSSTSSSSDESDDSEAHSTRSPHSDSEQKSGRVKEEEEEEEAEDPVAAEDEDGVGGEASLEKEQWKKWDQKYKWQDLERGDPQPKKSGAPTTGNGARPGGTTVDHTDEATQVGDSVGDTGLGSTLSFHEELRLLGAELERNRKKERR